MPLRPTVNRFSGCFCLGSGPVFFGFCCVFCCLLRCFRWRNASLAGGFAGRRFLFGCGSRFCCFNRFADSKDLLSLYSVFPAYSHVRTEPLARHRPHSRKKNVGASGVHIGCCLNPVEGSFLLFRFVWWLDCLLLKEGASAFCSLIGDCLKCFLLLRSLWVFAQVAGFHLNDCIEYFTAPCGPPLAPLDSYRSFQPRKNINYDLFSQSRY